MGRRTYLALEWARRPDMRRRVVRFLLLALAGCTTLSLLYAQDHKPVAPANLPAPLGQPDPTACRCGPSPRCPPPSPTCPRRRSSCATTSPPRPGPTAPSVAATAPPPRRAATTPRPSTATRAWPCTP